MKTYSAWVTNKYDDHKSLLITDSSYTNKKAFAEDLRKNGFTVHYIATPETLDEVSAKYNERRESRNYAAKCARAAASKTCRSITAFRDSLTIMTKERYGAIQADCDAEYAVKNATDEKAATKYALEKLLKALETMGTKAAETVADIIRMNLKNDEFTADCNYNEIQNGGNAYEIEINPGFSDNTLWIYIRIAEYMDEEPAADQEPEEETTENYVAWCGMIESDVITEEYETLSEAIDEVETKYSKEEQKALGVTYCRLLCTAGQWLECLDEKTVDDVYYF